MKISDMNIKEFEIKKLKRAEYNPRIELKKGDREYEDLKRSIQKYGYVEPIIVNGYNNRVIGGHQRITVLEDLGYTHIKCSVVNISNETQEKALNIILNKVSGNWDEKLLKEILQDLEETEEIKEIGFTEDELKNYLEELDINDLFTGEENETKNKTNFHTEKECPECGSMINVKEWKIVE